MVNDLGSDFIVKSFISASIDMKNILLLLLQQVIHLIFELVVLINPAFKILVMHALAGSNSLCEPKFLGSFHNAKLLFQGTRGAPCRKDRGKTIESGCIRCLNGCNKVSAK